MHIRIVFLWSMIISLSLAALMGIFALVFGGDSWFAQRILITALLVGGFSIVALMAAVVIERKRLVPLMWCGIGCAGAALLGWLILLWGDGVMDWEIEELILKSSMTAALAAIGLTHAGLMFLPKLYARWRQAVRTGAIVATGITLGLIIPFMWFEDMIPYDAEWTIWRTIGVFAILGSAGTIVTPVLWKLQSIQVHAPAESIPHRVLVGITCPRCQTEAMLKTGGAKCSACGLKITIDVEEPRCVCGYLLYQLQGDRCPECGRTIADRDRWAARTPSNEPTPPPVC